MSRDRLADIQSPSNVFNGQSYRQDGYGSNDLERNDIVAGERYELQDRSSRQLTINEYRDEISDAKDATSRLNAQITRIEQLHTESFASTESGSHAELDSLVASTSSFINSIKATLVRLGDDAKKGGNDAKTKVDLVNAQRRALQGQVQRFLNVEMAYRNKIRDRAVRQYQIVNPDATDEEISSALTDPNTQIFQQALLHSTRSSQARSALTEVQSRHNDIVAIERKVVELSQMFNELGVMVEFQDVSIDTIGREADVVQDNIKQGLAQITRTEKIMRSIRRKKWWCFGICVIIVIVVIVVPVAVTQAANKATN